MSEHVQKPSGSVEKALANEERIQTELLQDIDNGDDFGDHVGLQRHRRARYDGRAEVLQAWRTALVAAPVMPSDVIERADAAVSHLHDVLYEHAEAIPKEALSALNAEVWNVHEVLRAALNCGARYSGWDGQPATCTRPAGHPGQHLQRSRESLP